MRAHDLLDQIIDNKSGPLIEDIKSLTNVDASLNSNQVRGIMGIIDYLYSREPGLDSAESMLRALTIATFINSCR
jgi:hypothetical protein